MVTHPDIRWALAASVMSLVGCSVEAACTDRTQARTDPIKVADGTLAATDIVQPVVTAVLLDAPAGPSPICTATRIAPGVVLTAGHCVRDVAMDELLVRTAEDQARSVETAGNGCASGALAPIESSVVVRFVRHDELDLAVLFLEDAREARSAVRARRPVEIGQEAAIAGFGTTETSERGTLRAIEVDVLSVEPQWVTIQARGGGACTGDSGGPLYTWIDGELTLHGVLSRGSATCYGKDEYVPVLAANDWIDSLLER